MLKRIIDIIFVITLSVFLLYISNIIDCALTSVDCLKSFFQNYPVAIGIIKALIIIPFYIWFSHLLDEDTLVSLEKWPDKSFASFGYKLLQFIYPIAPFAILINVTYVGIKSFDKNSIYGFLFVISKEAYNFYKKYKDFKKRNSHIYSPSMSKKLIIDSNYGEIQLSLINQDGSYKTSFEKDIVLSLNSNIGPISLVLSQQKNHSSKKH